MAQFEIPCYCESFKIDSFDIRRKCHRCELESEDFEVNGHFFELPAEFIKLLKQCKKAARDLETASYPRDIQDSFTSHCWAKASPICKFFNHLVWRVDCLGNVILASCLMTPQLRKNKAFMKSPMSLFYWARDHYIPRSKGGPTTPYNLYPLQHLSNEVKDISFIEIGESLICGWSPVRLFVEIFIKETPPNEILGSEYAGKKWQECCHNGEPFLTAEGIELLEKRRQRPFHHLFHQAQLLNSKPMRTKREMISQLPTAEADPRAFEKYLKLHKDMRSFKRNLLEVWKTKQVLQSTDCLDLYADEAQSKEPGCSRSGRHRRIKRRRLRREDMPMLDALNSSNPLVIENMQPTEVGRLPCVEADSEKANGGEGIQVMERGDSDKDMGPIRPGAERSSGGTVQLGSGLGLSSNAAAVDQTCDRDNGHLGSALGVESNIAEALVERSSGNIMEINSNHTSAACAANNHRDAVAILEDAISRSSDSIAISRLRVQSLHDYRVAGAESASTTACPGCAVQNIQHEFILFSQLDGVCSGYEQDTPTLHLKHRVYWCDSSSGLDASHEKRYIFLSPATLKMLPEGQRDKLKNGFTCSFLTSSGHTELGSSNELCKTFLTSLNSGIEDKSNIQILRSCLDHHNEVMASGRLTLGIAMKICSLYDVLKLGVDHENSMPKAQNVCREYASIHSLQLWFPFWRRYSSACRSLRHATSAGLYTALMLAFAELVCILGKSKGESEKVALIQEELLSFHTAWLSETYGTPGIADSWPLQDHMLSQIKQQLPSFSDQLTTAIRQSYIFPVPSLLHWARSKLDTMSTVYERALQDGLTVCSSATLKGISSSISRARSLVGIQISQGSNGVMLADDDIGIEKFEVTVGTHELNPEPCDNKVFPIMELGGVITSDLDTTFFECPFALTKKSLAFQIRQPGPTLVVYQRTAGSFLSFVTHSEDPNCKFYIFAVEGEHKKDSTLKVILCLLRSISKGEHLSVDFRKFNWLHNIWHLQPMQQVKCADSSRVGRSGLRSHRLPGAFDPKAHCASILASCSALWSSQNKHPFQDYTQILLICDCTVSGKNFLTRVATSMSSLIQQFFKGSQVTVKIFDPGYHSRIRSNSDMCDKLSLEISKSSVAFLWSDIEGLTSQRGVEDINETKTIIDAIYSDSNAEKVIPSRKTLEIVEGKTGLLKLLQEEGVSVLPFYPYPSQGCLSYIKEWKYGVVTKVGFSCLGKGVHLHAAPVQSADDEKEWAKKMEGRCPESSCSKEFPRFVQPYEPGFIYHKESRMYYVDDHFISATDTSLRACTVPSIAAVTEGMLCVAKKTLSLDLWKEYALIRVDIARRQSDTSAFVNEVQVHGPTIDDYCSVKVRNILSDLSAARYVYMAFMHLSRATSDQ